MLEFVIDRMRRSLVLALLLLIPIPLVAIPTFELQDNRERLESFGKDPVFVPVIEAVNERNFEQAARLLAELKATMGNRFEVWEIEGTLRLIEDRPVEAAGALERALELNPGSPEVNVKYAVALFLQSKVEAAEAQLKEVLRQRPNQTYALRYLARIADSRGDVGAATRYYQQVIDQQQPIYTPMYSEFANFLLRSGQPGAVNKLLRPVLRSDAPADLHIVLMHAAIATNDLALARKEVANAQSRGLSRDDSRLYRALIDRAAGDHAAAERALRQLNTSYPDNPIVAYELAATLASSGDVEEGLTLADDLATQLSAKHVLRMDIADLMLTHGRGEAAAEVLGPALLGQPDVRALVLAIRAAMQSGDTDSGLRYSDGITDSYPFLEEVYLLRTTVLQSAGRSEEARALARLASERFPESVDVWVSRIGLLMSQNRLQGALETGEEALTQHPKHPALMFQIANIHEMAGRPDSAEAIYLELVETPGVNVVALNNLALLLARDTERRGEALGYAQQAYDLNSQITTIEDTLGWVLHLNGRSDEALAHLRSASRKAPDDSEILCHLGIVSTETSQAGAPKLIEECLALGPPQELATTVRALSGR